MCGHERWSRSLLSLVSMGAAVAPLTGGAASEERARDTTVGGGQRGSAHCLQRRAQAEHRWPQRGNAGCSRPSKNTPAVTEAPRESFRRTSIADVFMELQRDPRGLAGLGEQERCACCDQEANCVALPQGLVVSSKRSILPVTRGGTVSFSCWFLFNHLN
jgi:hypothetical protein